MTDRSYGVYVIEIENLEKSLYVGQSALTPEDRLAQHLAGYKSNSEVRKNGGFLRPDLYAEYPRFAVREQAEELEALLAKYLRLEGWTVYGGH